jgi:hypothetical protein
VPVTRIVLGCVMVVVSWRVNVLVELFVGRGVGAADVLVLWVLHLTLVSIEVRVKTKELEDVGAALAKNVVARSRARKLNMTNRAVRSGEASRYSL